MRIILSVVSLIFILGSLVSCQAALFGEKAGPEPGATLPFDPFTAAWNDRSIFRRGLIQAEQDVVERLPGASVYRLNLQISDDLLQVAGHEEVFYTNQENIVLNEIYFRLLANTMGGKVTLSAVKVNGQDIEPVYSFENSTVRIPLLEPLAPGEQAIIQADFTVQVGKKSAGNYGLFGYLDEVLMLDGFYPLIPVYNDAGWYVEIPPPNADTTFSDVSFYLVRVKAPANLVIAASGVEVERNYEGNHQTLTFAAGPARDFYITASENFTVVSTTVGETKINSYVLKEQTDKAEAVLEFAANSFRTFNRQFIPYPFTEFDVLSLPIEAMGIEYPGIVGISLALYDPDQKIGAVPAHILLESTVVHEVGHQWFYNLIGNDQINEPWLDESFAQYMAIYYYTTVYGQSAVWNVRAAWESQWEDVGRLDMPIGLPAGAYTREQYTGIVYGRGPLFISALAEHMGQRTFDSFLRDYQETYKWGISDTASFKQLAEHHCQCDLTALFEAWVYD